MLILFQLPKSRAFQQQQKIHQNTLMYKSIFQMYFDKSLLARVIVFGANKHQIFICMYRYPTRLILHYFGTLQWRHNGRDSVSNHQPHHCLLNVLSRRRSTKTSRLRVTGLCVVNSPGTSEFPAQMASNAENVSIWWRHNDKSEYQWSPLIWVRFLTAAGRSKPIGEDFTCVTPESLLIHK